MSISASPNYGIVAASADVTGLFLAGTNIFSIILSPTTFRPLTSFRATITGVAQKATGSTASLLSYTNLPGDAWHTGNPITGANYEIYFDSLTNAASGASGTWFGDVGDMDSWVDLGTQRTWTWQKDSTSVGSAEHTILIEIRNIATPADTTGVRAFNFASSVEI